MLVEVPHVVDVSFFAAVASFFQKTADVFKASLSELSLRMVVTGGGAEELDAPADLAGGCEVELSLEG